MSADPEEQAVPGPQATPTHNGVRSKPGVLLAMRRFGTVGALGLLVNLAVLHILHGRLGLHPTVSSAAATETAIIGNYIGNELWTFHHRTLHLGRLVRFNAVSLGSLLVTITVFHVLHHAAGLHYLAAQLGGIGAGAGLNFSLNFGWTWRR